MQNLKKIIAFLKENKLILATAESCTAGKIIESFAKHPGCGDFLDAGYVVYSINAKKRLLGVNQRTIDSFTLTSEEVAREMALGALRDSIANIVIATTGIAGEEAMYGIPPGTVCFAWGFKKSTGMIIYSKTMLFKGKRAEIQKLASELALSKIPFYYEKAMRLK